MSEKMHATIENSFGKKASKRPKKKKRTPQSTDEFTQITRTNFTATAP